MPQSARSFATMAALMVAIVLALVGIVYLVDNAGDNSNQFSRAAEDIGDGIENAGEEFRDRSVGEKVGDAIEDTGDAIKDTAK